ncbi:hypothetical protein D6783_05540, partial [Candidatus Woesearchaeota archaeon]
YALCYSAPPQKKNNLQKKRKVQKKEKQHYENLSEIGKRRGATTISESQQPANYHNQPPFIR